MLRELEEVLNLVVVGALLTGVSFMWLLLSGILTLFGVWDLSLIWIVGPELLSIVLLMALVIWEGV